MAVRPKLALGAGAVIFSIKEDIEIVVTKLDKVYKERDRKLVIVKEINQTQCAFCFAYYK